MHLYLYDLQSHYYVNRPFCFFFGTFCFQLPVFNFPLCFFERFAFAEKRRYHASWTSVDGRFERKAYQPFPQSTFLRFCWFALVASVRASLVGKRTIRADFRREIWCSNANSAHRIRVLHFLCEFCAIQFSASNSRSIATFVFVKSRFFFFSFFLVLTFCSSAKNKQLCAIHLEHQFQETQWAARCEIADDARAPWAT